MEIFLWLVLVGLPAGIVLAFWFEPFSCPVRLEPRAVLDVEIPTASEAVVWLAFSEYHRSRRRRWAELAGWLFFSAVLVGSSFLRRYDLLVLGLLLWAWVSFSLQRAVRRPGCRLGMTKRGFVVQQGASSATFVGLGDTLFDGYGLLLGNCYVPLFSRLGHHHIEREDERSLLRPRLVQCRTTNRTRLFFTALKRGTVVPLEQQPPILNYLLLAYLMLIGPVLLPAVR